MRFKLEMVIDNAAFDTGNDETRSGAEIARILRQQADMLEHGHVAEDDRMLLRDANGNTVGDWMVTD